MFVSDDRQSARGQRANTGAVRHLCFGVAPDRFEETTTALEDDGRGHDLFDRGIFLSLHTQDNNGLVIELTTDKYEFPTDRKGEILALAHGKRVADGAEYAKDEHLEAALRELRLDATPNDLPDAVRDATAAAVLVHGRGATARSILAVGEEFDREGLATLAPQAARNTWYLNPFTAAVRRRRRPERWVVGERIDPAAYDGDLAGTPAFFGRSDVDPHVPAERVHESADVFDRLGAEVTTRLYEGMGHGVDEDEPEHVRGLIDESVG